MNKTLLSAALIAGFGVAAFAPQAAHAANSGTINFSGKVYTDSCTITVNGGATVVLPVVATSAFASTVGTALTSSATPFNIVLTACDKNLVSAQMGGFTGGIDTTTGNLKNTLATNNTNAAVQVLSGTNVINFQSGQNAPLITLINGATATLPLTAQYITTATATSAGLLTSNVSFTLTYN